MSLDFQVLKNLLEKNKLEAANDLMNLYSSVLNDLNLNVTDVFSGINEYFKILIKRDQAEQAAFIASLMLSNENRMLVLTREELFSVFNKNIDEGLLIYCSENNLSNIFNFIFRDVFLSPEEMKEAFENSKRHHSKEFQFSLIKYALVKHMSLNSCLGVSLADVLSDREMIKNFNAEDLMKLRYQLTQEEISKVALLYYDSGDIATFLNFSTVFENQISLSSDMILKLMASGNKKALDFALLKLRDQIIFKGFLEKINMPFLEWVANNKSITALDLSNNFDMGIHFVGSAKELVLSDRANLSKCLKSMILNDKVELLPMLNEALGYDIFSYITEKDKFSILKECNDDTLNKLLDLGFRVDDTLFQNLGMEETLEKFCNFNEKKDFFNHPKLQRYLKVNRMRVYLAQEEGNVKSVFVKDYKNRWNDLLDADFYFQSEIASQGLEDIQSTLNQKLMAIAVRPDELHILPTSEQLAVQSMKRALPNLNSLKEIKKLISDYHSIEKSSHENLSKRIKCLQEIRDKSKAALNINTLTPEQKNQLVEISVIAQNKALYLFDLQRINKKIEQRAFRLKNTKGIPLRNTWANEAVKDFVRGEVLTELDPCYRVLDTMAEKWQALLSNGTNISNLWLWLETQDTNELEVHTNYHVPPSLKKVDMTDGICRNAVFSDREDNVLNGYFLYNIGEDGNLYIIGNDAPERLGQDVNHNLILNGQPVLSAGYVEFIDGKIKMINTSSGHFKPQAYHLRGALEIADFKSKFVLDKDVRVQTFNMPECSYDEFMGGNYDVFSNLKANGSLLPSVDNLMEVERILESFNVVSYRERVSRSKVGKASSAHKRQSQTYLYEHKKPKKFKLNENNCKNKEFDTLNQLITQNVDFVSLEAKITDLESLVTSEEWSMLFLEFFNKINKKNASLITLTYHEASIFTLFISSERLDLKLIEKNINMPLIEWMAEKRLLPAIQYRGEPLQRLLQFEPQKSNMSHKIK